MVDRLEVLLDRFAVRAQVFHTGPLCGLTTVPGTREQGQLHLIRSGSVQVRHDHLPDLHINTPTLLLYPQPQPHWFITDPQHGADFACAQLHFDGGAGSPVAAALPPVVCLPLDQLYGGTEVLSLLFDEAFAQRCGRRALLDRLFEVLLIQVLRQLMEDGQARPGMLGGMAHPRLRMALVAMHEHPAQEWTLDTLATTAGMSRSVFANSFRDTVGMTPGQYLQAWRIGLVQRALRSGTPLKRVAGEVGYGSEAALSRAFKAHTGQSPRDWKQAQTATTESAL